jgi:hypothetical protein
MTIGYVACCLALLAVGCGTALKGAQVSKASLRVAPDMAEIDGREFKLSASAWRDFMPIVPPGGNPMIVFVKLTCDDMMPMPLDLGIDHIWTLKGDEQWDGPTQAAKESPEQVGPRLEATVSGGPKWDTGSQIDVVVRLTRGKEVWLVRAAGVTVKRTD